MLSASKVSPQLKYILVKFFSGFTINLGRKTVFFLSHALKQQVLLPFHSSVFFSLLLGIGIWSFAINYIKNINNPLYNHWFLCPFSDFHSLALSALLTSLLAFDNTSLGSHLTRKSKKPNQQSHIMIEPFSSFKKWFIVLSLEIGNTLFPCYQPCICSPFPSPRAKLVHSKVLNDNTL